MSHVYRLLASDLSRKPLCCVPTENASLPVEIRIENYRLQDPSGFQIGFGKLDHAVVPRMVQWHGRQQRLSGAQTSEFICV